MSVTEVLTGLGGWSLSLRNVPADLSSKLVYYGHIAIHTGRVDYRVTGDAALTSSRFTGVLRKKSLSENENDETLLEIGGPGMAMWLGDEEGKGQIIEDEIIFTNVSFEDTIRALLPDSVTEGTLFNIGENFSGSFVYVSPREAINYVTSTLGAEWVMRGNGELDAGLESDLFRTIPKTIVSRKESGVDMDLRGYLGNAKTDQDVEDFTTRVVLLGNGEGGAIPTADADINPGINPYKDIHGNFVKFTRLVSESATDATNAPARAQLQLNRFSDTRDAMTLDSGEYDIKGDLVVGDYMWIHDPEIDLVDIDHEEVFRGKRINPMKLRLTEMTWPVMGKFSVGFRDWDGKWYNLTDYVVPESGDSTLVVGGYNRSLTGGDGGTVGPRPQPDTSVPDKVVLVTPFTQSVYQSPINGESKAQVNLKWLRPNNVDSSTIQDGDHYDIRWRNATTPLFPVKWAQLHGQPWSNFHNIRKWGEPIVYPATGWNFATAPWSDLEYLLQELTPSMPYEVQIRAVDAANPPNAGEWSDLFTFQTLQDTLPPATPAPPSVAASKLAIQLTHTLGRSDGGTFNLDLDMHHFDVHGGVEPNFEPSDDTLIGKLFADSGNITGQVPVVATLPIDKLFPVYFKVIAVDIAGNASLPSAAIQATAELVDDAHISSLTVSKVTAGTISADWINAAQITTAITGARTAMRNDGFIAFDRFNNRTFFVEGSTGNTFLDGDIEMPGAVRIRDSFGDVQAELGQLADGSYGMALRNGSNELLKLSDFVFGPQTAVVGNEHNGTNSFGWGDLPTWGPSLTVYVGPTRRAMVLISATVNVYDSIAYVGYEVNGATFRAPFESLRLRTAFPNGNVGSTLTYTTFLGPGDLNEGYNSFTLKYRADVYTPGAFAWQFQERRITVLPY